MIELLALEIAPFNSCGQEIADLVEKEEACFLARLCFSQGKISLEDLLDVYEMSGVDMDDFLIGVLSCID
jgi:hypothetical protein